MKATVVGISGLALAVLLGCGGSGGDDSQSGTGAFSAGNGGNSSSPKKIDDQCFVSYSQAAGRCNKTSGDDDAAFTKCLTPVKAALTACCKQGGSTSCAADATTTGDSQKKVDDQCFVSYSQAAGKCNTRAGNDDAAFDKCLAPVKATLVACCKDGGGSPSCADDASSTSRSSDGATLESCKGPDDHACTDPIVMHILSQSDLKVSGTDFSKDPPTPTLTPAIDLVNNWLAKPNDPRMSIDLTLISGTKWHIMINLAAGHEESAGGPAGGSGEGDAEADHLEFTIDGSTIVEHQIADQPAG